MKITAVFLFIVFISWSCILQSQPLTGIQLNQDGFYTHASKIAVVTSPVESNMFYLLSVNKKDTLYKGMLSAPETSAYSSTTARIADFSAFTTAGKYVLFVQDAGIRFRVSGSRQ